MPEPQYETRTPAQHFEALVTELNVPRQLAQAIREQESSRNPQPFQTPEGGVLTSSKNARGWFQVLPETAAGYGLDANDPFQNIEAGLRYIKEGLEKNNYDPDLAARYYHGGPDRRRWGPITEQYSASVGRRMRQLLASDGGQATPADSPNDAQARVDSAGRIRVPTAEQVRRATTPDHPPAPPTPPWYAPDQLLQTAADLGTGVVKGAGQTFTNLGRLPHMIPGVSAAVDALYGTPGLSANAFPAADAALEPTNTTQRVGKMGEQIAEVFIPGGAITRTSAAATARVAPRLAPLVGETAARLLPRAAVEATGAAGIAAAQGNDPTTAAGIAAAIPAAGTLLRLPFSGRLSPIAQRAVDWGRSQGIPIDLATSTANQWVRNIQTGLENTPLGAPVRSMVERVRGNRMAALGDKLAGKVHPTPTTPGQAGASVGKALDARVTGLRSTARKAYQEAEQIHAAPQHTQRVPSGKVDPITQQPILIDMQLPIDLAPIRRALQPMLNTLLRQPIAQQEASPALPALRALYRGGPFRSLLDLEADLGAIKGLADASGGLRNKSQGLAAQGVRVLQDALDTAAKRADPALLAALQKGRRTTALKHLADQLRTKFMGTARERRIRGAEPMRGYRQLVQPGDVNVEYLKRLRQEVGGAEMRKVGRGFLQSLLTTSTKEGGFARAAAIANRWDALGPQTKALLYPAKHIEALDNFFLLGRKLAEHPNPSRSALVGIGVGVVPWVIRHPESGVPTIVGAGAAAALMNHPTGVRLLTQGLTLPGGTAAASAWFQQVQDFLTQHEDEDEDEATPPPAPVATTPRVGAPPPAQP